jgi:hypothetical protein
MDAFLGVVDSRGQYRTLHRAGKAVKYLASGAYEALVVTAAYASCGMLMNQ